MIRVHIPPVFLKSLLLASAALPCFAGGPEASNVGAEERVTANEGTSRPAPDGMVFVAAGTTPGGYVTITNAFWIDRYEVTNQKMAGVLQWAHDQKPALVTASESTVRNAEGDRQELLDVDDRHCQVRFSDGTFSVVAGKGNHPCVRVTWYGAAAYCNYLSQQQGRMPAYDLGDWTLKSDANGHRLPGEFEWEYAARGGKDGKDTVYSGSDTVGDVAWYDENSGGHSHEVGTKEPNELGTYDMSGNVWEWCHNWYPGHEGSRRAERGGGWYRPADRCRVANRGHWPPGDTYYNLGFRTVLPAGR